MPITTRNQAQQRADQIEAFKLEIDQLEREKVLALSHEQHEAVKNYQENLLNSYQKLFDIDTNQQARKLSLGMRIASFLGAVAMAASVFFLFYQFWGLFSEPAQIGILMTASVLSLALVYGVQRYDSSGYFCKLAALVAFACFVLNISMLGQIFNITPSDKALLAWALYALLLAYACEVRLLLVAGLLCLLSFVAARMGTWGGAYWLSFGERPENFFPAALLILSVPLWFNQQRFSGFALMYRVFGLLALFLPMLVLSNWGEGSYLLYDANFIEGSYQLLGFISTGLVIWWGVRRNWPDMVNTGLTFFTLFLYTKFFDWWWESMPKYLFFLVIALSAILILLILQRLRKKGLLISAKTAITNHRDTAPRSAA